MTTIAVDANLEFIPTANTLALYHLEDLTDSSGLGNDLTDHGTVGYVAGKFRNCADFGTGNTTKWLDRADQLGLAVNAQRTYSCWVKLRTDLTGTMAFNFVGQGYSANRVIWFIMYYRTSNIKYLRCGRQRSGVATDEISYACELGTSVWHNVILTIDASVMKIYYDGALAATTGAFSTLNGTAATLGGTGVGTLYTDGSGKGDMYMDEVIIENVAWTAAEVEDYYTKTNLKRFFGEYQGAGPTITAGLYHLQENSNDSSGNGRIGANLGVTFGNAYGRFGSGVLNSASSYILLPTIDYVPTTSGQPLTISAWFKATDAQASATHCIVSLKAGIYLIYDHTSASYKGSVAYGSGGSYWGCGGAGGNTISNGVWHHMLGTYDGTYLRNYIDGKETGGAINLGAKTRTSGSFCCIGADTDKTSGRFVGAIDEVFIENYAWSATKIAKYYAYSKARFGIV